MLSFDHFLKIKTLYNLTYSNPELYYGNLRAECRYDGKLYKILVCTDSSVVNVESSPPFLERNGTCIWSPMETLMCKTEVLGHGQC